jgi:ABC-2 type transport system permease protein
MRAFGQLCLASVREWRRDSTSLLWSVAFPIILALGVGAIFSGTGQMFVRIGVVNEAGSAGQPLVDILDQNPAFRVTEGTRQEQLDALNDGQRDAVVVISEQIGAAVADYQSTGEQVPLDVFYDPSSADSATTLSLLRETIAVLDARLTGRTPLLDLKTEATSSNRLRSADYMLPGVLGLSLMLMGLYVTAVPLVSLREREVLRRMSTTPLRRGTMLIAQIVFRILLAAIQAAIVIAISAGLFDLPLVTRNIPMLVIVVLIGAAVFITLGYFLAALAKSEESVQMLAGLVFIMFGLFSGSLVPMWRMPDFLDPIVNVIPLTYLSDALRQVMVDANGTFSLGTNLLVLVAWLAGCTALALRFFKWKPRS